MPEIVAIVISGLVPLLVVIALLVLLKRIADGIDRVESTLERRLLHIQQVLDPAGDHGDPRWPPGTVRDEGP